LPEQGSLFAFTSPMFVPRPPAGVNVDLRQPQRPTRFFADSDVGVRLSTFWKGWDLTLNYLYHYDDFPVLFQKLSITPEGPLVTINPRYERTHLIGGTFSNAFGDLTVRGEIAFNTDKFFLTDDPEDNDGVDRGDELNYVLGLDWFGFTDTLVSFQLFQTFIIDTDRTITENKFDNIITLLIERQFLNETLEVEVLWLQSINDGDGLVRPRISYELRDNIEIEFGFDIFYGDKDGLFGEFRGNDRVVLGVEYGF